MKFSILNFQFSNLSKEKYLKIFVLASILLLGAFLRLYRINEYMTFLGDEGRDMLVVKRMIIDHKLTLLGPTTSVGSIYMGPIYYYMMIPFLWVWNFNPVGPSVMVALLAVATIYLIYKLGKDFFHEQVGLVASLLYAVAPLAIFSGRSSWNPNVVPFFSVLLIYSLLQIIVAKKYNWFVMLGLSMGFLIQLHYVTLLFFPVILVCFYLKRFKFPLKNYLLGLMAFIISYSPFLLFELRHQFVNFQAVIRFVFQQSSSAASPFIFQFWNVLSDVFIRLFWRMLIVSSAELTKLFIIILILTLIIYFRNFLKRKEEKLAFKIIIIWLVMGVISFGLYHGVIYDYYLGSLFAIPFILCGIMVFTLWRYANFTRILSIFIFISICFLFFKHSPLLLTPNNLLANTKKIAEFVYKEKADKPYNFALIAGQNSDHAYRYFLELWGSPPVTIENPTNDPQRKTVSDQLLVVCEEKICHPEGHPLWEIAGFGRAQIASQNTVVTAQVFRLIKYNKE